MSPLDWAIVVAVFLGVLLIGNLTRGYMRSVADFLAAYAEAGCRHFNVMPIAPNVEAGIEGVAEIRERLRAGDYRWRRCADHDGHAASCSARSADSRPPPGPFT